MKRSLLLTLALITVGCAEPIPRNLDGLVQQGEDTYLDRETMRPYSGPVFRFLPNDTTRVQLSANLKDGKFDGPSEDYYENGQLWIRTTYTAGERDGPAEYYHANGQLRFESTYVADELDGPYESYHANGQLERKGTYVAGEWHGPFENYYENGQLEQKVTFVAGQLDGPAEGYYENGQLQARGTLNMGQVCGEWIEDGETVTYDPCPPGPEDGN